MRQEFCPELGKGDCRPFLALVCVMVADPPPSLFRSGFARVVASGGDDYAGDPGVGGAGPDHAHGNVAVISH